MHAWKNERRSRPWTLPDREVLDEDDPTPHMVVYALNNLNNNVPRGVVTLKNENKKMPISCRKVYKYDFHYVRLNKYLFTRARYTVGTKIVNLCSTFFSPVKYLPNNYGLS